MVEIEIRKRVPSMEWVMAREERIVMEMMARGGVRLCGGMVDVKRS